MVVSRSVPCRVFLRLVSTAGAANVPIVGIKRVGREGNTVSVTAAGRGTIGFEPQVSYISFGVILVAFDTCKFRELC